MFSELPYLERRSKGSACVRSRPWGLSAALAHDHLSLVAAWQSPSRCIRKPA